MCAEAGTFLCATHVLSLELYPFPKHTEEAALDGKSDHSYSRANLVHPVLAALFPTSQAEPCYSFLTGDAQDEIWPSSVQNISFATEPSCT